MPRNYKGWEGHPAYRWTRMVKGKRLRVTCEELRLPESLWTKELSYDGWQAWLKEELADPVQDVFAATLGKVTVDEYKALKERLAVMESMILAGPDAFNEKPTRDTIDEIIACGPVADDAQRIEFLGQLGSKVGRAAPKHTTVNQAAASYMALKAGKRPKTRREIAGYLREYDSLHHAGKPILTADMDVMKINENTVENFYLAMLAMPVDPHTRQKRFIRFQAFVRHLWERYGVALPRNIKSTDWEFNVTPKAIKKIPPAHVKDCLAACGDTRLKLYALLALNCGMNNVDIGKLAPDQIDWQRGYLTRKRVKTAAHENVPVVTYKLWGETLTLLLRYRADHAKLVLTTMDNTPLYTDNSDMLQQQWKRKTPRLPLRMKDFRTFGSTTLFNSPYRHLRNCYKGNAPEGVSETHYDDVIQPEFDKAIAYIGSCISVA